jgi:hypothetical protein
LLTSIFIWTAGAMNPLRPAGAMNGVADARVTVLELFEVDLSALLFISAHIKV